MFITRRLAVPTFLFVALSWFTALSVAAQTEKAPPVKISPEPLALRAGDPLSIRTLVQRPASITGVLGWTLETKRHRGTVVSFAVSPDNKKVATSGHDGIIRLWDAESGEFIRALVGHNSYVYGVAFSPDGNTLASAGSWDGTARLWDVATGMTLRTLSKGNKGYVHHVAWSRDGKSLVVAGGDSGFMSLWDVTKPELVKTSETGNRISGIAWSNDNRLVAVSGAVIGVQVWDLREGRTPHTFQVAGQNGTSVSWSHDGKTIAGGSATKTHIWDADSGKEKHVLDAIGTAVAFNPVNDSLAVSSTTGVKVWSAFDKEPKPVPLVSALHLAWSNDGAALFGQSYSSVMWRSLTGTPPARDIVAAAGSVVQLTPGRPLITGIGTKAPELWDLTTGKAIGALEGHTGAVSAAAWSRDGKTLATASADKTVRLWDATGKIIRILTGHEGPVTCVAWADSKNLASGSSDKTVRIWQATADGFKIARRHPGDVTAVAYSKDGKNLASGDEEQTVIIGLADSDKDKEKKLSLRSPVREIAWSGKALAVGCANGTVEVFAPSNGKALYSLDRAGSPPTVTGLAWSPDGNTLLAGRGNHWTQVWQGAGKKPLYDLLGMAPVSNVAWSSSGNAFVISETDRAVRVYGVADGHLRASAVADAKQVAIVSTTGHYRVADEATCELVYVVQTAKGQETLTPKDFAAKYKFRNNPASAVLGDK